MQADSPLSPALQRKTNLRRSFRLNTFEGILATPLVLMGLPVNVFLIALFTKGLGLSNSTIGLLTAIPFACNFLQIFISPFLARWRSHQVVMVRAVVLAWLGWIGLALMLFWLPRNDAAQAGLWLGVWFFFTSLFNSLAGVAWNSWIQEWVPVRLRGKYFGRRNRWAQVSALLFLLSVGWVLANFDYALWAFQAIIVFAMLLRIAGIYFQYTSPTPPPPKSHNEKAPLIDQLREIGSSRPLVIFIGLNAIWFFATNCFGPFYHVFLFKELRFSAFDVGLMSTLSALGCALSMPAWGLLIDRYGNKPVMAVSLILWQLQWVAWCFLTPANRNLVYGLWLFAGAVSSGFLLGQFAMVLKLIPVRAKNLAIGINIAVTSLVAATAPVLGGHVLTWALERWPESSLSIYHLCFAFNPLLSCFSLILLLRMQEPKAANFDMVVGALRNLRTLSGLFGLGFLADFIFSERKKR